VDLLGLILAGLKPQSEAGYRKDFDAFARFAGAPSAEAALWALFRLDAGPAAALVLAYQSAMLDRQLAPATVARRVAALRRAVRRARMVGLTGLTLETESPRAEAFRDVRGPGAAGWRKMLERAEAEASDGGIRTARNLAIVLLLHDRALRRGEVVGLDLVDVDLQAPAVAVIGKGKRVKEWLTVNDPTREALVRYLALRGDGAGPLFYRFDAAAVAPARLTEESVNRMVRALARRAKLPREVRAHGLRHSAVTEALDAGWDVRDVKAFSRHSKIDTVLIYDDRRKDVGGEIARSLGRRRGKGRSAGK
jgi:integrase/recombinase XerC